jgi:hypothetical protein
MPFSQDLARSIGERDRAGLVVLAVAGEHANLAGLLPQIDRRPFEFERFPDA